MGQNKGMFRYEDISFSQGKRATEVFICHASNGGFVVKYKKNVKERYLEEKKTGDYRDSISYETEGNKKNKMEDYESMESSRRGVNGMLIILCRASFDVWEGNLEITRDYRRIRKSKKAYLSLQMQRSLELARLPRVLFFLIS